MNNINFTGMTGAQAFRAIDASGGVNDDQISANMDAWAHASWGTAIGDAQFIAAVKKFGNHSASYAATLAGHLQNCTEFDAALINEAAEELVRKDQEVKCMAEKIKAFQLLYEQKNHKWEVERMDDLGHIIGSNGSRIATAYGKDAEKIVCVHNSVIFALQHDHRLEFEQARVAWEKRISNQAIAKLQSEERVSQLEAELEAVGAGGVQPLRNPNSSASVDQQMLDALRKIVSMDDAQRLTQGDIERGRAAIAQAEAQQAQAGAVAAEGGAA